MNRIIGRTILISGATSGIGEACARTFASMGARLALCARREGPLFELMKELIREHGVKVRAQTLDVRDRNGVEEWAKDLADQDLLPDVLVNNAGLARGLEPLFAGNVEDWEEMIDTNLKGLLYLTRTFVPGMVKRNRGHVVNIGSTAGRWVYPKGAVYCATKFGVRALTEGLNMDLVGTNVRVSSVDPGMVHTAFSQVRFHGDQERAESVYRGVKPLSAQDIADVVSWVVNAPEHMNVLNVVLMPTAQRHPMVIHREDA